MIIRIRIRRHNAGARFVHPMDSAPRTAVLAPGFQQSKTVRVFPQGWNQDAARFHPTSIAAPLEELRRLARTGLRLEHAVIAFTYEDQSGLTHGDRELFWSAFGVPVFEQFLGPHNELLATECDAHTGLHARGDCNGLDMDSEACQCGDPTPRLSRGARIEELVGMLA
jgi:hypothetical protein